LKKVSPLGCSQFDILAQDDLEVEVLEPTVTKKLTRKSPLLYFIFDRLTMDMQTSIDSLHVRNEHIDTFHKHDETVRL
jgi:hypothetical protein